LLTFLLATSILADELLIDLVPVDSPTDGYSKQSQAALSNCVVALRRFEADVETEAARNKKVEEVLSATTDQSITRASFSSIMGTNIFPLADWGLSLGGGQWLRQVNKIRMEAESSQVCRHQQRLSSGLHTTTMD
jgi:hypothetical protein